MTQITDSSQNARSPNGLEPAPAVSDSNAVPDSNKEIQTAEVPSAPPPKSKSRRWTWLIAGTVVIAAIGAGAYWLLRPQNSDVIAFSGRIEGYETDVSTQGTGKVEIVTVRAGDKVKKGELLIRLDDDELQSELIAATGQVDAAKQREAAARLQILVLISQLQNAQLTLQQSEGNTSGQVAEAQALVGAAQAMLSQEQARVQEALALEAEAQVDSDRFTRLASLGAETQQRDDLAQTALKTAQAVVQSREAAVAAAQQTVEIARGRLTQAQTTTLNPAKQSTSISGLQIQLDQTKVALLGAQAEVTTALAKKQQIQDKLDQLIVNSPIDGVVTTRSVEPGTVVLPSRPLMRIVNLDQVYMRGFIPGDQIADIRIGQPAQIYLDNDPQHQSPLSATVSAVDSTASFTPENVYFQQDRVEQVFGVKLSIDEPAGFSKPGMPADAEILLQPLGDSDQ
jgi:HlyD family secretion protein